LKPLSAKRVAIVCNGTLDSSKLQSRIASFPMIVAVDGGALHCRRLGLKPHLIIGDFDSCPPEILSLYSDVSCKRFPCDKDETDLELALNELMHPDIEEITLFGALGNRVDHTLGNIILLSRFPGRLFIEDNSERIFIIDKKVFLSCSIGQLISLIPINGPVSDIHTEGLKWKLSGATLDKHFIGISNSAERHEVSISVGQGDLLCCLNLQLISSIKK
jgi:thiamine pyrophosphokinase